VYDSMVSVYDSTHIPIYMGPLRMTLAVTVYGSLVTVYDCRVTVYDSTRIPMYMGPLCMTLMVTVYDSYGHCV